MWKEPGFALPHFSVKIQVRLLKILEILLMFFEKEQHKRHKIAILGDYRLECVSAEIGLMEGASSKLM